MTSTPELEQDEPMSLADLVDLVRQTAECADTLVEHVDLMRRHGDAPHIIELHAIGSDLGMAWSYLRRAQDAATELAAVPRG